METGRAETPVENDRMVSVEVLISWLLRGGVLTSMATIVLGVALTFLHHPNYLNSTEDLARLTTPGAAFPRTLGDVVDGVMVGQGRAVVVLGLLVLLATPILRVAVAMIGFALQRDRAFTVISAVVLLVLLISFVLGNAE